MGKRFNLMTGIASVALDFSQDFYTGNYKQFLSNYAHDFLLPIISCSIVKYLHPYKSSRDLALLAFGFCSLGEIAQKFHLYPGTYDPNDFLAYAAGAIVGYGLLSASENSLEKHLTFIGKQRVLTSQSSQR